MKAVTVNYRDREAILDEGRSLIFYFFFFRIDMMIAKNKIMMSKSFEIYTDYIGHDYSITLSLPRPAAARFF